jgi:type II secretory pathway pseudopilin PulG
MCGQPSILLRRTEGDAMIFHKSNSRAGISMVEVMIAATLFALAGSIAISTFMFTLRSNKAQRTQMMMAGDTVQIERTIKSFVTTGGNLSIPTNRELVIEQVSGGDVTQRSRMWFNNGDGSDATVWDNSLRWDPNTATNSTGDEIVLARGISPIDDNDAYSSSAAIFSLANGSARGVHIRFRMGDGASTTAKDNANSGVGRQAYIYDSIFSIRNTK